MTIFRAMRITVANVERVHGEAMNASTAPAPVVVSTVLSDTPDVVEQMFPGCEIEDFTWDALSLAARLGQARLSTEPWPSIRVTTLRRPAIFL